MADCNATVCGMCSGDQYTAIYNSGNFTNDQIAALCTGLLPLTYNQSANWVTTNITPAIVGITEGLNCIYLVLCAALVSGEWWS